MEKLAKKKMEKKPVKWRKVCNLRNILLNWMPLQTRIQNIEESRKPFYSTENAINYS